MIGRILNKHTYIIPLVYFIISFIYRTTSKVFYADIFLNLSMLFFVLILVSLYLRDRFSDEVRTTYHTIQILIIMAFLILFLTSIPEYTYKEAQRAVEVSMKDKGIALNPKVISTLFLINPPKTYVDSKSSLLTHHAYLIYFKMDSTEDVLWYRFDPYTGSYIEVEPITQTVK